MAKVPKPTEFQRLMQDLRALKGEGVYQFLSQKTSILALFFFSKPEIWSLYFECSGINECIIRRQFEGKNPFDIITELTYKLSQLYASNFVKYSGSSTSIYPPKIANKVAKAKTIARTLEVRSNALSPQIRI